MQKYILIILLFLISCKGEVPQKHIDNRIIVFNMFVANGKITPFSIILNFKDQSIFLHNIKDDRKSLYNNNNQYILNREDALKDCILTKNTAHLFSEIDSILKTIDINNIKNNYSENEIIYADYISMSFYLLKDNKQIYHSFLPESGKEWHILNLTQDYIIKNDTVNADKWKLFYDK
ncbi:hypothetical protein JMN12_14355 [Capnocytophaga genosp. AHN8471]|jgi:lipoprotein|uniref:hypothetical protein n=1 Tax=Capnocytophaga TaxID=1016 RepID=UPI001932C8DA|nr:MULTISPECIES: hypothetical protein [Capnocytophaga]MBM0657697.1 hypothetical protein [Capnocytophaga genosp. AHN8471]